jgi:hypothetical protein
MSQSGARITIPARDGYGQYYTEKLWSWVPEIYQSLDADMPANGVLRAMIELVAEEAAILRRDIDRLWDDQAIELCDDWAISYLGALVSVTPMSAVNPRGTRLAAARAIAYQRRKGTPTVVQMAIRDIAGVEGVVVEAFRRMARFPHRLDIDAIATGAVTKTPGGGFADLRSARILGLTDSAFDEAAHFADFRRLRGPLGRYSVRKVNLHLFPYRSVQIDLPTPVAIAPGLLTLDPSGRDVALYQRGQTSDREANGVREVDLPDAILCRRFNASRHAITPQALAAINDPGLDAALAPLMGQSFDSAAAFRRNVFARLTVAEQLTFYGALLDATLTEDAPKAVLWGDSLALTNSAEHVDADLPPSAVCAANLDDWQVALAPHVAVAFDPDTGRMILGPGVQAQPLFVDRLHLGVFDYVGAVGQRHAAYALPEPANTLPAGLTGPNGGFTDAGPVATILPDPLIGTHRFATSRTYTPALPAGRNFGGITQARLDATDGARPYVQFRPDAATLDITFTAAAPVAGEVRSLEIDGLWLGLLAETIVPEALLDPSDAATPIIARIILDGDFDSVTLRQVTLDPGGERARALPLQAVAIPQVRLEIEGQVSHLLIDRCITGPIWETNTDPALCNAGQIEICDSIVQSIVPQGTAIQTRLAHVSLTRCTVLGRVEVARLYASNSVISGRTRVTDSQHGCFRYSATGRAGAVLPPQFEAFTPEGRLPVHWLRSTRFGDAGFAVLSETAPEALARGAENGAEMGVFNARALSVLLDDLAAQVRDLLPVGQTPQTILDHSISPREDTL